MRCAVLKTTCNNHGVHSLVPYIYPYKRGLEGQPEQQIFLVRPWHYKYRSTSSLDFEDESNSSRFDDTCTKLLSLTSSASAVHGPDQSFVPQDNLTEDIQDNNAGSRPYVGEPVDFLEIRYYILKETNFCGTDGMNSPA
eukprot:6192971-Pleurochrysis_carterae.AAC.1